MRRTYRYDAEADMLYEVGGNANYFEPEAERSANVISDDIGAGVSGLRMMHRTDKARTDSKSVMRADAKAAGLVEVGTERNFASKRVREGADDYGREVQKARDQIAGNYNGTADRLQRDRERGQ